MGCGASTEAVVDHQSAKKEDFNDNDQQQNMVENNNNSKNYDRNIGNNQIEDLSAANINPLSSSSSDSNSNANADSNTNNNDDEKNKDHQQESDDAGNKPNNNNANDIAEEQEQTRNKNSSSSLPNSGDRKADENQEQKELMKSEKPRIDWESLSEKFPYEKNDPDQKQQRTELFEKIDQNHSGKLSLSEVTLGLEYHMQVSEVVNAPLVVKAAFNTAKKAGRRQNKSNKTNTNIPVDEDEPASKYVEKREFRLLLLYLRQFFELYQLFEEIDTEGDLRISVEEFKRAGPVLEKWGAKIDDLEKTFGEIDQEKSGTVLFYEMAEWAMNQHLAHPDEE